MEIVSERVDLDPELGSLLVPNEVLHEICQHALDVVPEECCGLILGTGETPFHRAVRITNVMTRMHVADPKAFPRDARHAYYMSEVEYLRTIEEASESGEWVSGVYHSHFGQGCYLSRDDLAFAEHPLFPFPDAAQFVVSLLGQQIREIGVFQPAEGGKGRFVGRRVEAMP